MQMRERIARALAEPIMKDFDGWPLDRPVPWEALPGGEKDQAKLLAMADAALDALREPDASLVAQVLPKVGNPTERQREIGREAASLCGPWDMRGQLVAAELVRDWQAMIDSARTPPEGA